LTSTDGTLWTRVAALYRSTFRFPSLNSVSSFHVLLISLHLRKFSSFHTHQSSEQIHTHTHTHTHTHILSLSLSLEEEGVTNYETVRQAVLRVSCNFTVYGPKWTRTQISRPSSSVRVVMFIPPLLTLYCFDSAKLRCIARPKMWGADAGRRHWSMQKYTKYTTVCNVQSVVLLCKRRLFSATYLLTYLHTYSSSHIIVYLGNDLLVFAMICTVWAGRNALRISVGKSFQSGHMEGQEGDGRRALRWKYWNRLWGWGGGGEMTEDRFQWRALSYWSRIPEYKTR